MTGKDFWTFESLGCPQPEDKLWDQVLVHDTLVSWGALRRSPKHGGLVQSCHLTSALVPGPKAHPCSSLGLRYSPAKWKEGTQYFLTLTMHPHHFSSVQFSHSVVSNSLRPHEPQHASTPCPSPTPRVYPNSCPLSQWYHPIISSSVVPFSSCLQSSLASGSFQMSQLFASGGQSIAVSASTSVPPMNTQDWSNLGWTGWISLQSKGLSRVFSNTTFQNHQFFCAQLSL